MLDSVKFLKYFRQSVRLDGVSSDPAYNFSDEDLLSIVEMAVMAHNPSYTVKTVPDRELYFVLLKCKQEIYYRLATSSAPFYPIEAEGASLRKDFRFEHYMSLIRRIEQEYNSLWSKYQDNMEVQIANVLIDSYHYRRRNYSQSNAPTVEIIQCIPHSETVDLEWSKFHVFAGLFNSYKIYVSTKPIYDEFTDTIDPSAILSQRIEDIHKTKTRVYGLKADTSYNILVVSSDRNGRSGYEEIECKTLPIPY